MRKVGRHRRKKQKKILIIGSMSLLLFLCVGYAAFSTNLSLKAKGNIKCNPINVEDLKALVVTQGDGLYKDITDEYRYIYKGTNPNNFLQFDNILYRIISIEEDNSIKVVRQYPIIQNAFDKAGTRYLENSYCGTDIVNTWGCNVWGSKTTIVDEYGNHVSKMAYSDDNNLYELPSDEAYLNKYLNLDWFNSLNDKIKVKIISHRFNVGHVDITKNQNIELDIKDEKKYGWNGKIGLINITDYVKASNNIECINVYSSSTYGGNKCSKNNYLNKSEEYLVQWTINPSKNSRSDTIDIIPLEGSEKIGSIGNIYAFPSFFLSNSIELCGQGTEQNPYYIID